MKFGGLAARAALVMVAMLATTAPADARFWQCVPYARMISGVEIFGNAHTWWSQAAGKYDRGIAPKEGAVLAFASSRRMPLGHVAMVSKVVSDREVLLTHANWSRRGGVETNVRAIDVSANGDWSQVKVWYGPIGGLGTSANAARGFIYPTAPKAVPAIEQPAFPAVTIAAVAPVAMSLRARAAGFTLDLE